MCVTLEPCLAWCVELVRTNIPVVGTVLSNLGKSWEGGGGGVVSGWGGGTSENAPGRNRGGCVINLGLDFWLSV